MNDSDVNYMRRALRLAARAQGKTSPNPMVGAVIVRHDRIAAEDYHKKAGEPHAEALAIQAAGTAARNATLYVTLEPCCHTDKRTPPCTKAIISAGIKKVVVAMEDPNPKVAGRGIAELRGQGIEVVVGVAEQSACRLNEKYIKFITTRLPFVLLKSAMTLDGKIATPVGESKWITGEKARRCVHQLRSSVDAILTAIGTVKADNPHLTSRIRGGRNPLRVVLDPNLETPLSFHVSTVPPATLFVTREQARKRYADKVGLLSARGIEVISYPGERLDLSWLMSLLGNRGITSVLIEGGSSLNASAFQAGIVDKVVFFIAPKIIGGKKSLTPVGGESFRAMSNPYLIEHIRARALGDDIMIEGYVGREA
ncbi:MAG TPA: bifunctional diaminohydroxyphosphoribosylaminopyrimidine deaminase/5-amino-6-(5-phosphoribosylamino)uracil reductase RibD [Dissulfurispiraceae bacterium]|nr:bifunctional diaminohydroxyphosphoribosylaminopyrimidine deaminase/5-amino-6-(5-phosphoribosylamino)uracil reductase RibD [Dissulfurispiraceae bacterium]